MESHQLTAPRAAKEGLKHALAKQTHLRDRLKKTLSLALLLIFFTAPLARAEQTITMTFVGDCTIGTDEELNRYKHSFVKSAQEKGYAYFFANVKDLLAQDDLTVANMEGVFTDRKGDKRSNRKYNFFGPPEFVSILTLGNVDAVSLANNHAGDFGLPGLESTQKVLEGAGISWFNAQKPFIFEKNGIKVALLGLWRGDYASVGGDFYRLITQLKKEGVNAVICNLHFGQEYATKHVDNQTKLAYKAVDAGADLVIGHHPHVLEGVENYKNRRILYSLGNFVFGGTSMVKGLETMLARVTLRFSDSGEYLGQDLKLYPAYISGDPVTNDFQPRLVAGEEARKVLELVAADCVEPMMEYPMRDGALVFPYLDKDARPTPTPTPVPAATPDPSILKMDQKS